MESKEKVKETLSILKQSMELWNEQSDLLIKQIETLHGNEEKWFNELQRPLENKIEYIKDLYIKNFWELVYMVDKFEQISRVIGMENSNKVLDILDKLNEISVR